jgi:cold shock CspA family protein
MLKEGKIKTYNSEKGYGFIELRGSKDVFFHINDMPDKKIEPEVGETIYFQIKEENGKTKAVHINRIDVKVERERHTPQTRAALNKKTYVERGKSSNGNSLFSMIGFGIICVLGYFVYEKYQNYKLGQNSQEQVQTVIYQKAGAKNTSSQFSCDGRTHCSEMTSYEEAVYFLRNCPNVKMDGDGDGEPCESQFR